MAATNYWRGFQRWVWPVGALFFSLFLFFHFIKPSERENPFSFLDHEISLEQEQTDLEVALLLNLIIPPSTEAYNLTSVREVSQGQGQLIRQLFKNKTKGFFIECGALDGETRSNSLTLERELHWEGLLIEGDPSNVRDMKRKHRKSWIVPNCLSPRTTMFLAKFRPARNLGKIVNDDDDGRRRKKRGDVSVVCFPLHSILLALNRLKVDYFSLDVEGHEFEILRTIPFDKVDITALSVEYVHVGKGSTDGSKEAMVDLMASRGYEMRATVTNGGGLANDFIFVKRGFNEDVKLDSIAT